MITFCVTFNNVSLFSFESATKALDNVEPGQVRADKESLEARIKRVKQLQAKNEENSKQPSKQQQKLDPSLDKLLKSKVTSTQFTLEKVTAHISRESNHNKSLLSNDVDLNELVGSFSSSLNRFAVKPIDETEDDLKAAVILPVMDPVSKGRLLRETAHRRMVVTFIQLDFIAAAFCAFLDSLDRKNGRVKCDIVRLIEEIRRDGCSVASRRKRCIQSNLESSLESLVIHRKITTEDEWDHELNQLKNILRGIPSRSSLSSHS